MFFLAYCRVTPGVLRVILFENQENPSCTAFHSSRVQNYDSFSHAGLVYVKQLNGF